MSRIKIYNYIGGDLLKDSSHTYSPVIRPDKGIVYAEYPESTNHDIELAISSAKAAFASWSSSSLDERSKIMLKIADLIDSKDNDLALAESIDNGKPVWLAKKVDIYRASANFRFFAKAITQQSNESHSGNTGVLNYTLRQPHGIVLCISPWNLPLYLLTWKIAPALAAGNTVIAKPSEVTPMTAYLLSQICIEAGLPKGVLNILHGQGSTVGDQLIRHPEIKAISFTGSTRVGRHIASVAGPEFKKISLEMGGKNPAIIFEDCDFDTMIETVIKSSFSNQGQICLCGSRILVQRSIYAKFKDEFVKRAKSLKVGPPDDDDSDLSAIVSLEHLKKIESYIELAVAEGGKILCGGIRLMLTGDYVDGYYFEPTVVGGLDNRCRFNQEEVFGPVVSLIPFDSDDEALAIANDSPYGLSASIWTRDINRAHTVAAEIEAGVIWINSWLLRDLRTPFGGMKDSGVGREGGFEALRFFTKTKNVCIKYN